MGWQSSSYRGDSNAQLTEDSATHPCFMIDSSFIKCSLPKAQNRYLLYFILLKYK